VKKTRSAQARRSRQQEARRTKRRQIEQSYREHVTPQERDLRQSRWHLRVNPEPQEVAWEGDTFACPSCPKVFGAPKFLRKHVSKQHFPHRVP